MEPERKIEKWLRAFAKRRRADAGEPMKLHPATRRLLQAEVARMSRPPEESSLSLWQLLRQEWSWLAGFALIIFFCGLLFVPALNSAKHKAQSVNAMTNLKQIGLAIQMAAGNNNGKLPVSLDELTNELGGNGVLTDPRSGKAFVYIAGGETLDDLQTNSVLAYSPEDNNGRAVLFADGRVEMDTPEEFAKETKNMPNQLAMEREKANQITESKLVALAQPQAAGAMPAPEGSTFTVRSAAEPQSQKSFGGGGFGGFGSKTQAASSPVAELPTSAQSDALAERETANATTVNTAAPATKGIRTPGTISGFGGFGGGGVFGGSIPAAAPPAAASPIHAPQVLAYRNMAPEQSISINKKDQSQTFDRLAQSPVLASFQLEQNGDDIRVVDSDGSVYAGSLLETNANQNAPAQMASRMATFAPRQAAEQNANKQNMQSSAGGIPFRVTGMNRSSQQNVVFEGSLSTIPNPTGNQQNGVITGIGGNAANAGQAALSGQAQQRNQQQPVPLSNSRITGTATVGETNQIEVNAVSVTQ